MNEATEVIIRLLISVNVSMTEPTRSVTVLTILDTIAEVLLFREFNLTESGKLPVIAIEFIEGVINFRRCIFLCTVDHQLISFTQEFIRDLVYGKTRGKKDPRYKGYDKMRN